MILPNHRISAHDRDDFVRNLRTVLDAEPGLLDGEQIWPRPPAPLSPSEEDREPVLLLDEIKMHCRIDLDQTEEDEYLAGLEMAARIHTENSLRRPGALDQSAPENIKQAMLVLIAHWYRNREAVSAGSLDAVPLAYEALISTERDYSAYY
jgi:uncharacterized phage protein (predicted DNA packaging)